jgi:hypothetical protein
MLKLESKLALVQWQDRSAIGKDTEALLLINPELGLSLAKAKI